MGVLEFKLSRVDSVFHGRLINDFLPTFYADRVRSQKPGSGVRVTVFALKNPGRVDRVLSQKFYSGSVDLR